MSRRASILPPVRLIGVSVPRSGHHFLARLLGHALGEDLFHCEYYTPPDCCRLTPCTRGARVVYQKNHDLDLSLPPDLPGVTYVVQHREPLMAALSDREYLARIEGRERADDVDEYAVWLGHKAAYLHRFWDKWLRPERANRIVIDYEELLRHPVETLSRLLDALGIAVEGERLEAAAREASPSVADFPPFLGETPAFSPRTIPSSRYLDRDLLPVFESVVLDAIPELCEKRHLARVAWRGHPVGLVYESRLRLAAGDRQGSADILAEATRTAPANPYLWHELGLARAAAGDVEGALSAASEATRRRAGHPLFLRALSDAHRSRAERELDRAIDVARELARLRPQDPGALVHLASLLSRRGDSGEAQAVAGVAITLGSADPGAWRESSEIFARGENWEAAIATARDAVLRDESCAEYQHHLGNVLKRAGRTDEAIAAYTRALEMGASDAAWRRPLADLLAQRARDEVVMAYRLLLGREPENEEVVRHHASNHPDRRSLVQAFLSSPEFRPGSPERAVSLVEERLSGILAAFRPAGPPASPGPGHWVDVLGVRTRCSFRSEWSGRTGRIVDSLDGDPLEWLALLEALADAGPAFAVVELGAGHGPWLVRAGVVWRRRNKDAPLVLVGVEGEPTHARFLEEHAVDNGLPAGSVRVVRGAASAQDGVLAGTRRATVPAWSLPTLLADLTRVDLLHADVQGSESEVLASAGPVLTAKVARLFVGTHGRGVEASLIALLVSIGFRLVAETPCLYDLAGQAPALVRDGAQYWVNPALAGVPGP